MSVLVEAVTVIIHRDAIRDKYRGGWPVFASEVPNSHTLCADENLAGVSFLTPREARSCIDFLEAKGLIYLQQGVPVDIEVADQIQGLKNDASWREAIDFRLSARDPGACVTACKAAGTFTDMVYVPDGWIYEGSLSHQFLSFVVDDDTRYVTHVDEEEVYHDEEKSR